MKTFKKDDTVYFRPADNPSQVIRARITHVHRDGSYTVKALFNVLPKGQKDTVGFLGEEYRMRAGWFSDSVDVPSPSPARQLETME